MKIQPCDDCKKKHLKPFGKCPIYKKIYDKITDLKTIMESSNNDYIHSYHSLPEDDWVNNCKFNCGHYEKEEKIQKTKNNVEEIEKVIERIQTNKTTNSTE